MAAVPRQWAAHYAENQPIARNFWLRLQAPLVQALLHASKAHYCMLLLWQRSIAHTSQRNELQCTTVLGKSFLRHFSTA